MAIILLLSVVLTLVAGDWSVLGNTIKTLGAAALSVFIYGATVWLLGTGIKCGFGTVRNRGLDSQPVGESKGRVKDCGE